MQQCGTDGDQTALCPRLPAATRADDDLSRSGRCPGDRSPSSISAQSRAANLVP